MNNLKLSVIISMYDTREYIEQSINSLLSFCNQFNVEYEILLGIDGNKQDLDFILNNKLSDKVNIYFNEENQGPYVMYNHLIDLCKYDKIFIFSSDDYLNSQYYNQLYNAFLNNDYVRIGFYNLLKGNRLNRILLMAYGTLMINKSIIKEHGYFENWFCAADAEFTERLKYYNVNYYELKLPTFYRRIHLKSLTQAPKSNFKSKMRLDYKNIISERMKNNNWIKPVKIKANIKKIKNEKNTNKS